MQELKVMSGATPMQAACRRLRLHIVPMARAEEVLDPLELCPRDHCQWVIR